MDPCPDSAEGIGLAQQARAGDADAFSRLAIVHELRLYRQALALCGNPGVAEELAAETLVEAWRSIRRFNGRCRFSTWLYAILLHRHQKLLRRRRNEPIPFSALGAPDATACETLLETVADRCVPIPELLAQREANERLRDAVARLPERHRCVVLLRFYEDATLLEVAVALGLSVGTVKSRLHHAMEKLRRLVDFVNGEVIRRDTR